MFFSAHIMCKKRIRHWISDAVKKAMSGEKHFTDPEFVAAAQMFADMAKKEYFVVGMNTIDPGTATSMLMNGQAAMNYDGSWKVSNLNSEDNAAGPEGIGFFNVPVVNDSSTLDDYSMNCGNILMFSSKKYDEKVGDWMKFVFPRLGDFAMQETGSFKGFKISKMPEETTYYTQIVADRLASAKGAFLWFEAKMDSETSTLAQNNISLLYTGEMSAEEYMRQLEESAAKTR
jgi:raffinose/stachyose/melibiose transport system substrate-binding protein